MSAAKKQQRFALLARKQPIRTREGVPAAARAEFDAWLDDYIARWGTELERFIDGTDSAKERPRARNPGAGVEPFFGRRTMDKIKTPEYLSKLPDAVPRGKVLVHNHVNPTRRLGSGGFRAWLAPRGAAKIKLCPCGFAPELGRHYWIPREGRAPLKRMKP